MLTFIFGIVFVRLSDNDKVLDAKFLEGYTIKKFALFLSLRFSQNLLN